MESQVQCPNCGGYKVGYQYPGDDGCMTWTFLLAGVGGLFSCIFLTLLVIFEGIDLGNLAIAAFMGAGGALVLLIGIAALQPRHTHLLECHLCGYKWDTRSTPPVTVRPELILKGEEKLRAEQEEERKRQEAMWWWQQQQKKK